MAHSRKTKLSLVLALFLTPLIIITALVLSVWLTGHVPDSVGFSQKARQHNATMTFPAVHQITDNSLEQAESVCSCVLSVPKGFKSGVAITKVEKPVTDSDKALIRQLKAVGVCGFVARESGRAIPVVREGGGRCML